MSIFDDVSELLDPAGIGYKLMTGRDIAGAALYPNAPSGTLRPAYVLRKNRRLKLANGDEINLAGEIYAPAAPVLPQTAAVVLSDGDHSVYSADIYQDNDAEPGSTPFQVILFQ